MKFKSLNTLIVRAINDVFAPNRFGVSKNLLSKNQMPYGLDYSLSGMEKAYGLEFDENGIVMMRHYYDHLERYEEESIFYYSPVKIAHYAVAAYNDYLKTNSEDFRVKSLKHIDYLMDNSVLHKNCVVWSTPSSNPKYELEKDYISAIVQGLVISSLCRGYMLTGDEKYLEKAKGAISILLIPVEKDGLLASTKWGDLYEEYPSIPYSHVINGFMFCLMGLYDIHIVTQDSLYKDLFDKGINSLKSLVPDWVEESWAKYDLRDLTGGKQKNYATRHYQFLHIDQLKILGEYSNEDYLKEVALTIERQVTSWNATMKMYWKKYSYLLKI